MLSIEQQLIIDRAQHPHFGGELKDFTHKAEGANLSCGDEITMYVRVEDETIVAISHQCRACTICASSADLLSEFALGAPVQKIMNITAEDWVPTLQIPLSPVRQKCALLPLATLKDGLALRR